MNEIMDLSSIFKVLADPSRLAIFNLLMCGVHCNCEIAEKINLPVNLISHHLKVLSKAELITSFRKDDDARWIYYCANPIKINSLRQQIHDFLDHNRIAEREPICLPGKKLNQQELVNE